MPFQKADSYGHETIVRKQAQCDPLATPQVPYQR
jgi:hypothetical protein